jgi:hypothetical protein
MGAVSSDKVFCDIGFQVAPSRRLADRQEIEHKFGDGVGCGWLCGLYMGEIESCGDVIAVAVFGAEGVSEAA